MSAQIREEFTEEQLAERLHDWALNHKNLMQFLPFAKQRMETFSEFVPLGSHLVSGILPIESDDLLNSGESRDEITQILQYALWSLEPIDNWKRDRIFESLKNTAAAMNIKLKVFLAPLFIAIAGSSSSISVMDSMHMLGADMSRARLRYAIELLGGVSKKKLKALEKNFTLLK